MPFITSKLNIKDFNNILALLSQPPYRRS